MKEMTFPNTDSMLEFFTFPDIQKPQRIKENRRKREILLGSQTDQGLQENLFLAIKGNGACSRFHLTELEK